MKLFNAVYYSLLELVLEHGDLENNTRTGVPVIVRRGMAMHIPLDGQTLPICTLRRTNPLIAAAELAWCFSGLRSIAWLRRYTKAWDAFADERSNVNSAYGFRWKLKFGIDQITQMIYMFQKDRTTRRVWISSWYPNEDLTLKGKTVPCPVGFTVELDPANRIHVSVMLRSSDLVMGLPYDVLRFALFIDSICISLNAIPGSLTMHLANAHIYKPHIKAVGEMLDCPMVYELNLQRPCYSYTSIGTNPDKYMDTMKALFEPAMTLTPNLKIEVIR